MTIRKDLRLSTLIRLYYSMSERTTMLLDDYVNYLMMTIIIIIDNDADDVATIRSFFFDTYTYIYIYFLQENGGEIKLFFYVIFLHRK